MATNGANRTEMARILENDILRNNFFPEDLKRVEFYRQSVDNRCVIQPIEKARNDDRERQNKGDRAYFIIVHLETHIKTDTKRFKKGM